MVVGPILNRFAWSGVTPPSGWDVLFDFARRLDACVCSEATTERTNGLVRRTLGKHSQSMGHPVLLARMIIAKAMMKENLSEFASLTAQGHPNGWGSDDGVEEIEDSE